MIEFVVLVNENNNQTGIMDKRLVHFDNTPMHRGFSVFIRNSKGELLLTKRSSKKKVFPGIWSNSVCGHPQAFETNINAVIRRINEEIGIKKEQLIHINEVLLHNGCYTDHNGIVENICCAILMVKSDSKPILNKDEVDDWKYMSWLDFIGSVEQTPDIYTPWTVEEARLLSNLEY